MVDYMKTSMSMRSTWPLKPEDQVRRSEWVGTYHTPLA